jgi:uncharacterized membrane protein YecN with MAPEG domain
VITPAYAAILALIFVALSVRTLLLRRKKGIAIGTADDPELTRAMRAHGNFAEYVPISLLLLFFLESRTGNLILIHALCTALVIGRLVHAYGVSQINENYRYRVAGMFLTFGVIIYASLRLLSSYA